MSLKLSLEKMCNMRQNTYSPEIILYSYVFTLSKKYSFFVFWDTERHLVARLYYM